MFGQSSPSVRNNGQKSNRLRFDVECVEKTSNRYQFDVFSIIIFDHRYQINIESLLTGPRTFREFYYNFF